MSSRYVTVVIDSWTGKVVDSALKKTPIKDAIAKYLNECTSLKCLKNQSTERLYFGIFAKFLADLNIFKIGKIKREHIDSFESTLLKKMGASSVNRRLKTFRHFFNKCIEWKYIYESPFEKKEHLNEVFNPRKAWTKEIFEKFYALCDGDYLKIYKFFYLTGARQSELINLRWTDIDFDEKTLIFRCGKNGGDGSREFPINPELDKLLHSVKMTGNLVFTINEKPFTTDNLYQYSKHRLNSLGLTNYTQYGLRHGFGTRLAKAKVPAFYIAYLMGHKNLKTTDRYIEKEKNHLIQILNDVS